MSTLRLDHPHTLTADQARDRVRALGDYLQNKYGVGVRWTGENTATIQGKYLVISFEGAVTVGAGQVTLEAKDPGMLWRTKAREYLDGKLKKYLDPATPLDALPRR